MSLITANEYQRAIVEKNKPVATIGVDRDKAIERLGELCKCITLMAHELGVDLDSVMKISLEKEADHE